jgi:pimeloyl-ACP methyl ester carboxylesterase
MREIEIGRGGRVLRVRDTGEPEGNVVMYFHGTPGSRLDLGFGEQLAAERGVRLVSFDRPGYGGSTPAPFGLASIAADAHAIADELGVARFATLGMSGGGPGALAAAAVAGGRISRAGIASGAGSFRLVPGALADLDDNDRAAVSLLPGDPAAAAAAFAAGFEPLQTSGQHARPSVGQPCQPPPDHPDLAAAAGSARGQALAPERRL